MWNSAVRKQATTGPAPPKATSVKSRGSSPWRAIAWLNSAYASFASATSMIASAAASMDRPAARRSDRMASRARAGSSRIRPPTKLSGFTSPQTTNASVEAGSVPPRP
jgi:hypothetical protein